MYLQNTLREKHMSLSSYGVLGMPKIGLFFCVWVFRHTPHLFPFMLPCLVHGPFAIWDMPLVLLGCPVEPSTVPLLFGFFRNPRQVSSMNVLVFKAMYFCVSSIVRHLNAAAAAVSLHTFHNLFLCPCKLT